MGTVTDPAILQQLNSSSVPFDQNPQTNSAPSSTPPSSAATVTDPAILAQLNASTTPFDAPTDQSTGLGLAKSAGMGLVDGVNTLLSGPNTSYNAIGNLHAGAVPAWIADQIGMPGVADFIKKYGFHGSDLGSADQIKGAEKQYLGLDYQPRGTTENLVNSGVSGATSGAIMGAMTGGGSLIPNVLEGAVTGLGGSLGQAGAEALNDKFKMMTGGHGLPTPVVDLVGILLGAKAGGKVGNLSPGIFEPSPTAKVMADSGVTPRFASDVNPDAGTGWIPNRLGAQNISSKSAQMTQDEIAKYGDTALGGGQPMSTTDLGQTIQTSAQNSIDSLKTDINTAYDNVRANIPGTTPVPTTQTSTAMGDFVNRATDPDVQSFLNSPAMADIKPLMSKPSMTWDEMNSVRQKVGAMQETAEGQDNGFLKQIYAAMTNDMQASISGNPAALSAFQNANQVYQDNMDKINKVLKPVVGTPNSPVYPEKVPNTLMQGARQGASRLDSLLNTPGFSATAGDVGKGLLNNAARNTTGEVGDFDLDRFMKLWNGSSPEAQKALTQSPEVAQIMSNLKTMTTATAASKGLIGSSGGLSEPMLVGAASVGSGLAEGAIAGHAGALLPAAAAAAYPTSWAGAAMATQRAGLGPRLGTAPTGAMTDFPQQMGIASPQAGAAMAPSMPPAPPQAAPQWSPQWPSMPSLPPYLGGNGGTPGASPNVPWSGRTYGPNGNTNPDGTPMIPQVAPEHVRDFLSNGSPDQVAAYVGSKLGPQIGSQVSQASSPEGHAAAMFQIMSSPVYRRQLLGALAP